MAKKSGNFSIRLIRALPTLVPLMVWIAMIILLR